MRLAPPRAAILGTVLLVLLLLSGTGQSAMISLGPAEVHQGDAFLVVVNTEAGDGIPEATFQGRPIYFSRTEDGRCFGVANVELHLEPATYPVTVRLGGQTYGADVTVLSQNFPVERLTLPEGQVTLSPEDARRARDEAARLGKIWPTVSEVQWAWPFHLPLDGKLGTRFGTRRILNGIEKSPHNGTDIKAPRGTPVRAVTAGRVVLSDELFYGGKTLVLDHGGGLFSFYMHLDEFLVKEGERVGSGVPVATVGSSGRSTGPHLHVGMKLGGVNLNPLSLVELHLP